MSVANPGCYCVLGSFVVNQSTRNLIPDNLGELASRVRSALDSIDSVSFQGPNGERLEPANVQNPLITIVPQEYSVYSRHEVDIQAWIWLGEQTATENIGDAIARTFFSTINRYPDGTNEATLFGTMMVECSQTATRGYASFLLLGFDDPNFTQVCLQVARSTPERPVIRTVSGPDRLLTGPIENSNQGSLVGQRINPVTVPGVQDIRDALPSVGRDLGEVFGMSASDVKALAWAGLGILALYGGISLVRVLKS